MNTALQHARVEDASLPRRGHLYVVDERYADTRPLERLAERHEVVPLRDGAWNILLERGVLHARPIIGLPRLPDQQGALFRLRPRGDGDLPAVLQRAIDQGLTTLAGTWNSWPKGQVENPGTCCGASCGCGPCQATHKEHR
jgi:hypothetical protein